MESYEFDLFEYWDDLEYADDSYWDSGLPENTGLQAGQKRKRGDGTGRNSDKRQKKEVLQAGRRDLEPLVFRSRAERNRLFFRAPPRLEKEVKFAFLPDWRQRFADEDGVTVKRQMPAAMRRAAEGKKYDSPMQKTRHTEGLDDNGKDEGAEEEWEDEEEEEEEMGGMDDHSGFDVDPGMLKAILQEKLGAAGLDGLDEAVFMETIQKMMSGEGDNAAGELATALLGKITSNAGDEAVSGWLSQQGVSLGEGDDDDDDDEDEEGSSTTTGEGNKVSQGRVPEVQQRAEPHSRRSPKVSLHSEPAPAASKKRTAPSDPTTSKRQKKVRIDEASSPVKHSIRNKEQAPKASDSEGALPSEESKGVAADATKMNELVSSNGEAASKKRGRKRKATADEPPDHTSGTAKSTSKELESLGASPDGPFPAPPAKRTRSAKAKTGK